MSWAPRTEPVPAVWIGAKWAVLAGAGVLLAALVAVPSQASRAFWYAIVPALPAVFLVNAEAWRNLCPVATLSTLRDRDTTVRPLTRQAARRWTGVGIGLFLVLVPLRQVFFEISGPATAALLGAAALGALVGGRLLDRKAGFCNSICPILPIERLYGQRPMTRVANTRCVPCRACTQHACFDLNPERSGLVALGPSARDTRWVLTPFGAFALAMPGFVVGFSLAPETSPDTSALSAAASVYGAVAAGAVLSWLLLASAFAALGVRPARALLWSAAAAVSAYYWFTPAAVVRAWALDAAWLPFLRACAFLLVGTWTWRALLHSNDKPLVPVRLEP